MTYHPEAQVPFSKWGTDELTQERDRLRKETARALAEAERHPDRPETREEKQSRDRREIRFEDVAAELQRRNALGAAGSSAGDPDRFIPGWSDRDNDGNYVGRDKPGAALGRDDQGREIRSYGPETQLRDVYGHRNPDYTFGDYLRGVVLGDWSRVPDEVRTMTSSSGSGSYLIPDPLSTSIIDAVRAKARVFQAGARTIPMEAGTLKMARLDSDPTVYYRGESAAITASEPTFAQASFSAKTGACLVKLPAELFDDMEFADDVIDSISMAMSQSIDYQALLGDGSGATPTGIANAASIESSSLNTAPTLDNSIRTAVKTLLGNNADQTRLSAIYNSDFWATADSWVGGDQQVLARPESWNMLRHYVSNQIPTTTNETTLFVGQFDHLGIGLRKSIEVRAFESGNDGSTDAVANYEVWLRAVMRYDVQLLRPSLFYVMDSINVS